MATIQIKRSTTAEAIPSTLAVGELAANIVDDPPRAWIGTLAGVKPLIVQVPLVRATVPVDPAPNTLWIDTTDGTLYLWFDDGDSKQWIQLAGGEGPQGQRGPIGADGATGATGATGPVDEAPEDGVAYARKDADWTAIALDDGTY